MSGDRGLPPPGFQLPPGTHPGGVRLRVSSLGRSEAFYTRIVGLQVLERTGDGVSRGAGGEGRTLVRLEARAGLRPVPRRGRFGLFHFAILLPDRAALGRAARHLLREHALPGMADHLVSEALYLSDPDGLGIEIYADRPPATWTYRGRELEMTTDPLDLAALVAAGGDEPWTGVPPATTIGHVHLHVGSLETAAAFYHAALGFDQTVWSYPGAMFLSAGGYHHHLATNTWSPGPAPAEDEARLVDWELIVPDASVAAGASASLAAAGYEAEASGAAWLAADPWGTHVRIVPAAEASRLERA